MILAIKTILWPVEAIAAATTTWLFKSKTVYTVSGRGRTQQAIDLLYLSFWRGFPPIDYYDRRLYFFRLSTVLDDFLSSHENSVLNDMLNRIYDVQIVDNKFKFGRLCKEFGLPAMPTIAAFQEGKVVDSQAAFPFPKTDLYFKPSDGLQGKGIERWNYEGESDTWSFDDQKSTEEELRTHFLDASTKESFILEPAAFNHPAIECFSTGPLITFRVMTVLGPGKETDIMASYMVIPTGHTPANHGSYGGMVAQLNLSTYRLDAAMKRLPTLQRLTHHPETGAKIEGYVFEEWPQLAALAEKAHSCFPTIFSIGWDLAMTRDGPVIIEGNTRGGPMPGYFPGRSNYCRWHLDFLAKDKARGGQLGLLLH